MTTPTTGDLYADLSRYYDGFCEGVDYAGQADFLRRAHGCFGESGGRDYLDLGCGTGVLLAHMQQREFTVSGLDYSRDMLDAAARRCPQAELLHGDMAALDAVDRYDLISSLLYSLHYSHPLDVLSETLRRAFRALKPGGMLLFDAVDKRGLQGREVVSQGQEGDATFTYRSGWVYPEPGETMELRVSIRREQNGETTEWQDRHAMTALTFDDLRARLEACGFDPVFLERDFSTLRRWDGQSLNVLVAALKPLPAHAAATA